MLRVDFDLAGITTQVDKLRDVIQGAIRPAAQAAAQVFYDEVKLRAGRNKDLGNLAASIYQKYVTYQGSEWLYARYHISWRKGLYRPSVKKPQRGGWGGLPIAYHGQLIEYGWVQRYATYMDKKGNWWTAVRPEMRGKPKPKRRAPQAVKDAYYVLRKGGPIQHPPRSFLRASYEAKKVEAAAAADREMQERILKAFL